MAPAISLFVILSCALFAAIVQADVSHLGYNRFDRIQTTRLQRLESGPKPYAASGFRPHRQFNLPREQPLFPLGNHQPQNNKQTNNGFDNLGEPQRPQATYGAPTREQSNFPQNSQPENNNDFDNLAEPRFPQEQSLFPVNNQQPQANLPQNNNGFGLAEAQRPELTYSSPAQEQSRFPQQSETNQLENNNGFDNLAESQRPDLTYGAPAQLSQNQAARLRQLLSARLQQQQQAQPQQLYVGPQQSNGFTNVAESQSPQLLNKVPARLRQPQPARLQQQPQQFYVAPQQQLLNEVPARLRQPQPARLQQQPQQFYVAPQQQFLEPQAERFIVQKPARLTDNREDSDDDEEDKSPEVSSEIETDNKKESDKKKVETTQNVTYFPAGAFSFVQPSAAYVAAGLQQNLQPVSAAYTVGSPFLQQPYAFAAPAQLRAW